MRAIKENNLYRLFSLFSKRRKDQIYFLFFLLIINGISESIALICIVPFLSLIISGKNFVNYETINKFLPFSLTNYSNTLGILTIIFCIFILSSTLIRVFNNWYILKLTANINIDLANSIFKRNIYQSYKDYTEKNSSEIITLLIEKNRAGVSALKEIFYLLLGCIIGLFIILTLLIYSWKVILISFSILYIYYYIISKKIRKILYNIGKFIALYTPIRVRVVQDSFNGFRDIIINGTELIYINLFNKYNSILSYKEAKAQYFITLPKFLIEGTSLLVIAIVGYFISISNNQNTNLIPLLGAFVYSLQRLLPLGQLTYAAWAGYKLKAASIEDVLKELENNKITEKISTKNKKLAFNAEIKFNRVFYSYTGSNNILNNVSLSIKRGDHIGIYGETGSGKSTLLDVFMGLLPPQKGSLFIDEINIFKDNYQKHWTSNIAHVPQNTFLKEGNIAENIAFGETMETLDFELLERSSKTAQIYQFIKKSKDGFLTMVGERGIKLSGGQRQRIAIARALYKSREILVLDEATSALDDSTEKKIVDKILEIHKNLTVIMVTHRLNSLRNCNRIFKITSKGEVLEE